MDTYVSVFVLIFLRLSVSPFQSSYACLCKSFVNFCTCFNLCEFICFILWVYFVRICFLFLYLFFKSLCICFCSFMFQFESENVNQSYTWQTLSFRTKSFEIGFQISLGQPFFFYRTIFFSFELFILVKLFLGFFIVHCLFLAAALKKCHLSGGLSSNI